MSYPAGCAVFHRHPNAAPLLATRNCLNVEALRRYEAYLQAVQRDGFTRRGALDAVGAIVGQALGYGLLELRSAGPTPVTAEPESDIQRIRRVSRSLPTNAPDSLIELAVELTQSREEDSFAISVDALLTGLYLNSKKDPAPDVDQ